VEHAWHYSLDGTIWLLIPLRIALVPEKGSFQFVAFFPLLRFAIKISVLEYYSRPGQNLLQTFPPNTHATFLRDNIGWLVKNEKLPLLFLFLSFVIWLNFPFGNPTQFSAGAKYEKMTEYLLDCWESWEQYVGTDKEKASFSKVHIDLNQPT
jgi:hypothetical protein